MDLSDNEIQQRIPVWVALSDLFLDTDVTFSYGHISRVCSESPYTIKMLKEILYYEVAPVLLPNLSCVTGEWAGFNEEWLIDTIIKKIQKTQTSKFKHLIRFKNSRKNKDIEIDWEKIELEIIKLRKGTSIT